jgi:hypothetical protein
MSTKTLLIAAATLAAATISSQAQVYSQNVVGYINQTIPATHYQIIGSQLINGSDANATNGDVNTTLINGLISSPVPATIANPTQNPALSTNSQLIVWNGAGFATYFYFNQADATSWEGTASPAGWYDAGGSLASVNLSSGLAAFVYNHAAVPLTVTTVGTVFQGSNVVSTINPGYNLICLQVPISTNLVTDVNGNPIPYGLPLGMTSSNDAAAFNDTPTLTTQDTLIFWNGSGYSDYFYFNQADATTWEGTASPAGFYDAGGSPMPTPPSVNQGFFLHHIGPAINWTNTFTVQ